MLKRSTTVRYPASPMRPRSARSAAADDRIGQGDWVAGRNEETIDAIGDDFGDAADRGGDDRDAPGHRLEDRDALRLAQGGQHRHREIGGQRRDVLAPPGEDHATRDPRAEAAACRGAHRPPSPRRRSASQVSGTARRIAGIASIR